MKLDYSSPFGLETIDFQDNSYFKELAELFRRYKTGEYPDKKQFMAEVSASFKRRFNINVKFKIDNDSSPNAYILPPTLNENSVLAYRAYGGDQNSFMWDFYKDYAKEQNFKVIKKILKGDLSPTGLLDYKNARVGGLFANMPETYTAITTGLLKLGTPEECAAVMLHEIGHYWTFLEWLGILTCRNIAIHSTVTDFLGAKTEQEKINIIVKKNNHYGLEVDPTLVSKLDTTDATNVLVGAYTSAFKNSQGYIQYDNNMSEFVADQFAARMCGGEHIVTGLYAMYKKYGMTNMSTRANMEFFASVVTAIGGLLALGIAITTAPQYLFVSGICTLMGLFNIVGDFNMASTKAGDVYDNTKDRFQRVYNEELKRLKNKKLTVEQMRAVLISLDAIQYCINKTQAETISIPSKILRFISSNYRQQEAKMFYQQISEELLANKLYATSAKLKVLEDKLN